MTRPISEETKLVKVKDASSANTGDVTSDSVNMAGYSGVEFFSSYGTAAADNLPNLETSSDDGVADAFTDLAGTEVGVGSSDEDVWVDVANPREQYIRAIFARGTSTTLGDIWAILYGAKSKPVDNTTAGTIHGETHIGPAEGTK